MKRLKIIMIGTICLVLCFSCFGCATINSNHHNLPSDFVSETKSELVGFAVFMNVDSLKPKDDSADNLVSQNISIANNGLLTSKNNFIFVASCLSGYKNADIQSIVSNTTVKFETLKLNGNKFNLSISIEVYIETQDVYAYIITKTGSTLSANLMGKISFDRLKTNEITKNIDNKFMHSNISEIKLSFKTDLSTSDTYKPFC